MKNVTATEFETEVLQAAEPVLVDFYTADCPPCRYLTPVLGEIAQERGSKLKIVKVDALAETELTGRFRVVTVPTLLLFRAGQCVGQRTGAGSKKALLAWLDGMS